MWMIEVIIHILLLVMLIILSYIDIKRGIIENKKLFILWILIGILLISKGESWAFFLRTIMSVGILYGFSEKFPYAAIGGGDIKMAAVSFILLGEAILYMLLFSLSLALLYGKIRKKKKIRMAPFFSFGIILCILMEL